MHTILQNLTVSKERNNEFFNEILAYSSLLLRTALKN